MRHENVILLCLVGKVLLPDVLKVFLLGVGAFFLSTNSMPVPGCVMLVPGLLFLYPNVRSLGF